MSTVNTDDPWAERFAVLPPHLREAILSPRHLAQVWSLFGRQGGGPDFLEAAERHAAALARGGRQ